MAAKAITPDEAGRIKFEQYVPDQVIDSVNELIARNLGAGGRAKFTLDAFLTLVVSKMPEITRQRVLDEKWADFEPFYEAAGWKVEFDKPAYNESYPATYEFSRKKKTSTYGN